MSISDKSPLLFTKQNVATVSRSLGTVFKNTTGKPMFVAASCNVVQSGAVEGRIEARVDLSNPPTTVVSSTANNSTLSLREDMTFIVEPNNFYEVIVTQGSGTLQLWTEWS